MLLSTIFLSLLPTTLGSFYDNPELEIPPASGSPLDELKAKWDFDVSTTPGPITIEMGTISGCGIKFLTADMHGDSGGFQEYQHLRI